MDGAPDASELIELKRRLIIVGGTLEELRRQLVVGGCQAQKNACMMWCAETRDHKLLTLQPERNQCLIAYLQAITECNVIYAHDPRAHEQCRREIEDAYQACLAPIEEEATQAEVEYEKCVANCESEAARCGLPDYEPPFTPPPQPEESHDVPEFPPPEPPPGPVWEPT
jgi:hypothetical protein